MPGALTPATAEQVVMVVTAVVAKDPCDAAYVASFTELQQSQVDNAIQLAIHLNLLDETNNEYSIANPIARFLATPNVAQKASVLRVVVECYEPFRVFRQQLVATDNAVEAAKQTRALIGATLNHTALKDALISLATFANALNDHGGGRYSPNDGPLTNDIEVLATACSDKTAAELRVRLQMATASSEVDHADVIAPLGKALLDAAGGNGGPAT